MITSLNDFKSPFFIGLAGTGMSAIAQYLQASGKQVSGSDRFFAAGIINDTKTKLELEGISCFEQNGEGITDNTDLVVISTAVEETVPELKLARSKGIPVIRRSELLAIIAASKKTIAVGGTSGKSSTSAMLFDILENGGLEPGIISGAGLISLIRQGKIGNAKLGKGEWLIIEADESDGSIVQYKPEIGLLLNVDKDHKEIDVLMEVFTTFRNNSKHFVVNRSHPLAAQLSAGHDDFSWDPAIPAAYMATDFKQEGLAISFKINGVPFEMNLVGKHNMENALAATAVASLAGLPLAVAADALKDYQGIYRRHQVLGNKDGVWVIDDFAHNPIKCAAAIEACQPIAGKVIAWFQPHGYGPTKFLRNDFVTEIGRVLRPSDEIWMSEIFYAGGTAVKDISSNDLINDLKANGKEAFFVENRNDLVTAVRPHLDKDCVLLLMGARDPSLEEFAKKVWAEL
ncbi:MAG: Mur ligase domain-containing protein [Chitinophagaceae bacterium]